MVVQVDLTNHLALWLCDILKSYYSNDDKNVHFRRGCSGSVLVPGDPGVLNNTCDAAGLKPA